MDLAHIKNIIEKYRGIDSGDGINVFNERGLLSRVRELIEWQTLSSKEKHEKRKFVFSVINKTGNSEEFHIEIAVIELYELADLILSKIVEMEESKLKTRLEAMLRVLIYHIDEQRDVRFMKTSSFNLVVDIAKSCIKNNDFLLIREELDGLILLLDKLNNLMEEFSSR